MKLHTVGLENKYIEWDHYLSKSEKFHIKINGGIDNFRRSNKTGYPDFWNIALARYEEIKSSSGFSFSDSMVALSISQIKKFIDIQNNTNKEIYIIVYKKTGVEEFEKVKEYNWSDIISTDR